MTSRSGCFLKYTGVNYLEAKKMCGEPFVYSVVERFTSYEYRQKFYVYAYIKTEDGGLSRIQTDDYIIKFDDKSIHICCPDMFEKIKDTCHLTQYKEHCYA